MIEAIFCVLWEFLFHVVLALPGLFRRLFVARRQQFAKEAALLR
jgi:hypothetical protein